MDPSAQEDDLLESTQTTTTFASSGSRRKLTDDNNSHPSASSSSSSSSSSLSLSSTSAPPSSPQSESMLMSAQTTTEHLQTTTTTPATTATTTPSLSERRKVRTSHRSSCQEGELDSDKSSNSLTGDEMCSKSQIEQQQGSEDFRLFKPLSSIVCLDDFELVAKKSLEKSIYDYYCQGADDETTLNWNRTMIAQRYCLRPRVMCDVSQIDLTKYIFGDKMSLPIGVSPTAMQKMAHPDGELAMVRACTRVNCLMILSFFSTTSLEDVAKEAPICTKWQNIYILKQREITQNLINRATRYGYRALVVTCDAPILGNRRRDARNQFTLGKFTLENLEDASVKSMRDHSSELFDPSLTWSDLADLKKSVGDTTRVIAKGIMTPEDAELAIEAGVDAIFISNHGGRQLDGSPSTIEALPAIVRAVKKRCPVFVDGGFRTGADILKALALGADMVFLGRPPLWALAGYGEEGAFKALKMLEEELRRAMMLCGCTKLSDINSSMIGERPLNVLSS